MKSLLADMRETATGLGADNEMNDLQAMLDGAIGDLENAVDWLIGNAPHDPNTPGAASVNLLMLAGTVIGGWQLARTALILSSGAGDYDESFCAAKLATARFYFGHILPRSTAYSRAAMADTSTVMSLSEEQF